MMLMNILMVTVMVAMTMVVMMVILMVAVVMVMIMVVVRVMVGDDDGGDVNDGDGCDDDYDEDSMVMLMVVMVTMVVMVFVQGLVQHHLMDLLFIMSPLLLCQRSVDRIYGVYVRTQACSISQAVPLPVPHGCAYLAVQCVLTAAVSVPRPLFFKTGLIILVN